MSSYLTTKSNWEVIPVLEGSSCYQLHTRLSTPEGIEQVYRYLTSTDTNTGEANRFINDILPHMQMECLVSVLERMYWDLREFYTTPSGHYIDHDKYDSLEKLCKDRYLVWACTGQSVMPLVYILEALRKVSLVCRMPD